MSQGLQVRGLVAGYGSIQILREVSLEVKRGETVCVLGANGAGKTTLVQSICGFTDIFSGTMHHDGVDLRTIRADERPGQGIALVPEGRRLFPRLSVEENLTVAFYHRRRTLTPSRRHELLARTYDMFPILAERRGQLAGTLSGGQQQMVSVGRALLQEPALLVLDEPSFGLAPIVTSRIYEVIKELAESGELAILLVEQSAALALNVADRAYVMQTGSIVAHGAASEIADDPATKSAYLGATA